MSLIRPSIKLHYGRVNEPLSIPIDVLLTNAEKTFITTNTVSGIGVLTVKSISGFAKNKILLVGEPGNEGSEILKTHATTQPSGSTITLAATTTYPHSAGTWVYIIPYDQVALYNPSTASTANLTTLSLVGLKADSVFTTYVDTVSTAGFYYARFRNSITPVTYSPYSDAAPFGGYGPLTARNVIDNALDEINKKTSDVLTDEFGFQQINNCQQEVIRELKRWSFMQKFDSVVTQTITGYWSFAVPTDLDDQNTNKSIYNVRLAKEGDLTWVDKEKFNGFLRGVAYSTLSAASAVGATTVTLTDSSDFGSSGTIQLGPNAIAYSANNKDTGVITLTALITAVASGLAVFEGAALGKPTYWTTFGGNIYTWPVTSSSYNKRNWYMDYYKTITTIVNDTDTIVLPDPMVVSYYLQWKFLKKLNNGVENEGSLAAMNNYLARRAKLVQKEVIGKTFVLRPRFNDFSIQSSNNTGDTKKDRLGAFPNI